ncbi:hypothetical protein PF010_g24749 [Phytophthora fragariae]|uniref:Secreted protein n=1 Tax=Phytophthora fragariae TaxID=53985 RepID=A0A6G0K2M8_9STRA|nr:hypothetical protein PF010_g24749 [Phytophthora fragariae]
MMAASTTRHSSKSCSFLMFLCRTLSLADEDGWLLGKRGCHVIGFQSRTRTPSEAMTKSSPSNGYPRHCCVRGNGRSALLGL